MVRPLAMLITVTSYPAFFARRLWLMFATTEACLGVRIGVIRLVGGVSALFMSTSFLILHQLEIGKRLTQAHLDRRMGRESRCPSVSQSFERGDSRHGSP